ncbi:MAG TPA: CbtA family protein, partial [Pseudomonas sp.]|nr:CbtA family protein [Pseudomonas sp.]
MLKRIAQTAGFAGLLAAIVLTLLQSLWVTPLILQAETFETSEPAAEVVEHSHDAAAVAHEHEHGAAGHSHDGEAWAPED